MNCRVCDSIDFLHAIDLGMQPWCNDFLKKEEVGKDPFYPLRAMYYNGCSIAQIDYTVKKEVMLGDHTYLSGVTKSLSNHFKKIAEDADTRFLKSAKGKSVNPKGD